MCNLGCSQNYRVLCIQCKSLTQTTRPFIQRIYGVYVGGTVSALEKTISAKSVIEFSVKWSTFFLHIAEQAAELSESSLSWLLWILLVTLLQVCCKEASPGCLCCQAFVAKKQGNEVVEESRALGSRPFPRSQCFQD